MKRFAGNILSLVLVMHACCVCAAPPKQEPKVYQKLEGTDLSKLIGAFRVSKYRYTPEIKNLYLQIAEASVKNKAQVAPDFWEWLSTNPDIREGLLGANYPVHPGAVENLDRFRRELEPRLMQKYSHLALAVSIALKEKGFDAGTGRGMVGEDLKQETEGYADTIAAHLTAKNITMVDFSREPDPVLTELGIDLSGKKKKLRGPTFSAVALKTNTYPDREFPSSIEFVKYLIDHHETEFLKFNDGGPEWPEFPIDKAPWPLLMPLSETRPLDECDFVWDHFIGERHFEKRNKKTGEITPIRVKRYGRYTWEYNELDVKYRKSDWHPSSYPRILEDGGVCGRQSAFARTSLAALGHPAMQMGQPGHSALMSINMSSDGKYFTKSGQSIAPMFVSTTMWYFGDADNFRCSGAKWGFQRGKAEMQVGLALAMNVGLSEYMDTRILLHICRMLPESCDKLYNPLLFQAASINPYNTEIWYELARRYGTDLVKINKLVEMIKLKVGSPDATVEFTEEKSADTDFGDLEDDYAHMPKVDLEKAAKGYASTVYMAIVQYAYKKAYAEMRDDKATIHVGYAFLKEEYAAQEAVKKSPFKALLSELLSNYDVEVRGFEVIKQEAEAEIIAQIQGMKKFNTLKKRKEIPTRIEILANRIEDRDQRAAWIQSFRDAFKGEEFIFHPPKKGKEDIQVDALYDFLVKLQAKTVRGKRPRKVGSSESKKVLDAYEAMKTAYMAKHDASSI